MSVTTNAWSRAHGRDGYACVEIHRGISGLALAAESRGTKLDSVIFQLASLAPPLRRPGGTRVLCYHGIDKASESPPEGRYGVEAAALEAHLMAILDSGLTVVRVSDLERCGSGSVLLTFDDNLASHVVCALPILRSYGVTATFYLSPADLGVEGQLSHHDVRALLNAGMLVGVHGHRHVPAANIGPHEFDRDVKACRTFLKALGMPLTWAYPGGYIGSFHDYHEQILLDHGFTIRFATLEGVYRHSPERVQPRYVIRRQNSTRYVRAALRGGLQLVSIMKRLEALAGYRAHRS